MKNLEDEFLDTFGVPLSKFVDATGFNISNFNKWIHPGKNWRTNFVLSRFGGRGVYVLQCANLSLYQDGRMLKAFGKFS